MTRGRYSSPELVLVFYRGKKKRRTPVKFGNIFHKLVSFPIIIAFVFKMQIMKVGVV